MRLFIGLPLPSDLHEFILQWVKQQDKNELHWIPPENYHVTTLFIGKATEKQLIEAQGIVAAVATRHASFNLQCTKIDFAPSGSKKRMIWAYFEKSENFANLVTDLHNTLSSLFLNLEPLDNKHRTPHLTLLRFKNPAHSLSLKNFPVTVLTGETQVTSLILFSSQLTPTGAIYQKLQTYFLDEPS